MSQKSPAEHQDTQDVSQSQTVSQNPLIFLGEQHHEVHPAIDPAKVKLPVGFAVCILGASRGIGASIAYAYALAGATTLIITARSASSADSVAARCREIKSDIMVHCEACDVGSNDSVEFLANRLKERQQSLNVVVFNSGFAGKMVYNVTEGDPVQWKTAMDVNTLGTYHAAHHLLPIVLGSKGLRAFLVVSTAAVAVTEGILANSQYCISKMAQQRLVEMIAKQYQSQGLLIVGVHPGAVVTEMAADAPEEFRPYLIDSVDLCGAFLVRLSNQAEPCSWLTGRWLSATWDVERLVARKDEIVQKDLLKFKLQLS